MILNKTTILVATLLATWYYYDPFNQSQSVSIQKYLTNFQQELAKLKSNTSEKPIKLPQFANPPAEFSLIKNITGNYRGILYQTNEQGKYGSVRTGDVEIQIKTGQILENGYPVLGNLRLNFDNMLWVFYISGVYLLEPGVLYMSAHIKGWEPRFGDIPYIIKDSKLADLASELLHNVTVTRIKEIEDELMVQKTTKKKFWRPVLEDECYFSGYMHLNGPQLSNSNRALDTSMDAFRHFFDESVMGLDGAGMVELISQDCGLSFVGSVKAELYPTFIRKTVLALLSFGIISFLDIVGILSLYHHCRTPLVLNKLSPATLIIMIFYDLMMSVFFLSIALSDGIFVFNFSFTV
jgi:hypothetical protein